MRGQDPRVMRAAEVATTRELVRSRCCATPSGTTVFGSAFVSRSSIRTSQTGPRHRPGPLGHRHFDTSTVFADGAAPTRREPLFQPEPGVRRQQERFAASRPTAPRRLGAAIRRDHGRENADGRMEKKQTAGRRARCSRPRYASASRSTPPATAPQAHVRQRRPGHKAGARERRVPKPAAGRTPRHRPEPRRPSDHHETKPFANRLHRARCFPRSRRLPSRPLATIAPTLGSNTSLSRRPSPPAAAA